MIRVFNEDKKEFTNLCVTQPSNAWNGYNAVITGDILQSIVTGNGGGRAPGAYYNQTASVIGHKYFVKVRAKVDTASCESIQLNYGGVGVVLKATPSANTEYDMVYVLTATSAAAPLYVYHYYVDAATANGKVMTLYDIVLIDLTVAYGAGSEPTATAMNKIKPLWSLADHYSASVTKSICVNDFTTNGEKVIDPIRCVEIIEDNVDWRVEVEADISYQPYLLQDYILVTLTKEKGEQPFRINNVKVDNLKVTFTARHIGYDTENHIAEMIFGYTYTTGIAFHVAKIIDWSLPKSQFYTTTTNWTTGKLVYKGASMLESLYEIISMLGGHLTFDWFKVNIDQTIGSDRGVTIEYGKNLDGAEIAEDWDSVCTQIYPIGNNNLTLGTTTNMIDATGVSYDRPYTRKVFFQTDDVVELDTLADAYLEKYKVPKLNYKVSADTVQDVALGDTIYVYSRQFNIATSVLGYKYNILSGRIEYVEFGNYRRDLKSAFSNIYADIDELKKAIIQENITMNSKIVATTYTPVINGSSSAGSGTYTYQHGYYTKIGNLVLVDIALSISAHTGTGNIRVTLPFTAKNTTNFFQTLAISANSLTLTASHVAYAQIDPNTDYVRVMSSAVGSTTLGDVAIDATCSFRLSGCYVCE